jgi:hypothetical protein
MLRAVLEADVFVIVIILRGGDVSTFFTLIFFGIATELP